MSLASDDIGSWAGCFGVVVAALITYVATLIVADRLLSPSF